MITSEYRKIINLDQSCRNLRPEMVTLEWETVLDKTPEKRCYLEEVLPSFGNYTVQVRSFNLIEESPRHGETGFEATLDLNICTMDEVYKFIEAFEESSFTSLNLHEGDRVLGKNTTFYARTHCHHRVKKHKQRTNIPQTNKLAKTPTVLVVTYFV